MLIVLISVTENNILAFPNLTNPLAPICGFQCDVNVHNGVSEWVGEWVGEEWVSGWVGKWVSGWVGELVSG